MNPYWGKWAMRNLIIAISLICLCAFTGSFVLCTKDTLAVDGGPTGWWSDSDGNNYYGDSPSDSSSSSDDGYYYVPSGPSPQELERKRRWNEAHKLNKKGNEYLEKNDYDNAIKYYKEALEYDPDDDVIERSLAIALGQKAYDNKDFDAAIKYYNEALAYGLNHSTNSTIRNNLRDAEEQKKRQADKQRREAEEARLEKEARLLEQKLKEAKQNVNNILDDLAKKFDVSPPVSASKSSGLALKGSSATNKPRKPSRSSGLSLKGPPRRLFEKGTKDSAPVGVIREADEITRQLYRQELMKDFEDSPEGDEITRQLYRQELMKDFEDSPEGDEI
ncbi:MAG: tetratricopeptide repeat protein, partial [Candidatus Brocadiales bacterium]|nr:tetratricopeptide repeat protein [Candidatus Bathyanammoxibius amoris]